MGLIFYKMPLVPYPIKYSYIAKALANRSFNKKTLKDITPDFFSLEQALPNIKAPTLILWSEKDRVLDISSVPLFEKGIRNHKKMIFKDCGHAPMIEKSKETAAAYSAFIQDITLKNSKP